MSVKTVNITYQRVLNLGNYESKRLELTAEVLEGEDVENQISSLMELVELKIREDSERQSRDQIKELKREIKELTELRSKLQLEVSALKPEEKEEDPDGIPFDQQSATQQEDKLCGF